MVKKCIRIKSSANISYQVSEAALLFFKHLPFKEIFPSPSNYEYPENLRTGPMKNIYGILLLR